MTFMLKHYAESGLDKSVVKNSVKSVHAATYEHPVRFAFLTHLPTLNRKEPRFVLLENFSRSRFDQRNFIFT